MISLFKAFAMGCAALMLACGVRGQTADAAQTQTQPANPPPQPAAAAAQPQPSRQLRQLIIGESIDALKTFVPAESSGFVVLTPALAEFDVVELTKRLTAAENQPIEERILAAITKVVETFVRQHQYHAATAIVPTQNIADGKVRLLVDLGPRGNNIAASEWKIRKINIQGARWFSESMLREKLRIEQGQMVRFSDLNQSINWTNNNPYRQVRVQLDPIPNTGEADLSIAVQDAIPLRLTVSADNSGNDVVGRNRYVAGISYANLWGLDHQFSYQYITTNTPEYYKAHGLDYRIPLRWRHYLQLSGSYFRAKPVLLGGFFQQDGETVSADMRYTIPITMGNNSAEFYAMLSFKQSNNNLLWDPRAQNIQVLGTKTDIYQLTVGASTIRRDRRGAWAFGASVTASPGGISSRNTDEAFDAGRFNQGDSARIGARAQYVYASLTVQRLLLLGYGWDITSRAIVQGSQANLLPSEQFSIGGASSVRGFNESVYSGDLGYLFSSDLGSPVWRKKLPGLLAKRGPMEMRGIMFVDFGDTASRRKNAGDTNRVALASTGVGLRMTMANNFSLTADYGWQLTRLPYEGEDRSRAHIKATLAF